MFCKNCGQQLLDDSRFCHKCGTPIIQNNIENETNRKMMYDGEIHKCPNCGKALDSFTTICPQCSFELRGVKSTNSVRELSIKLEQIEKTREKRKSIFTQSVALSKTDEQKITLIKNFPIPNTKEDITEFMILAASNISYDATPNGTRAQLELYAAWSIKFEQAYNKAIIVFGDDSNFDKVQSIYNSTHKKCKKNKNRPYRFLGIFFGIWFGVLLCAFLIIEPINTKKETARLENIVIEVENALKNGEYKFALMQAETLKYGMYNNNEEEKRKWDVKKEYLIDKILSEAAENGVEIEHPSLNEYNLDSKVNSEDIEQETRSK